ncbi:MAG: response regulator [Bacteroidales bacterium]|nr:response regulator [Bacteroidales bacterium]
MNEKPKILIVEDDIDLVESTRKILEMKGYEICVALDPDIAWERLKKFSPDLIILDVMFGPREESLGFEFARKIKHDKQTAGIPIIMLSAINAKEKYFNFSPATDGDFLPVDCFLDKPLDPDELYSKIQELIKLKSSN